MSLTAVANGYWWLLGLTAQVGNHYPAPLISDTNDGGVMYEWWNHELHRKLTVYIYGGSPHYIRVWGANINTEMDEGSAEPIDSFIPIWRWVWGEDS